MLNTPRRKNYRGQSFKGKDDLNRKDFSYADIRGVDFTGANLVGANFSGSIAGHSEQWSLILQFGIISIAVIVTAFLSTFVGAFVGGYTDQIKSLAEGLLIAAFTALLFLGFIFAILQDIGKKLWFFALSVIIVIIIIIVLPHPNESKVFAFLMAMLLVANITSGLIGAIAVAVVQILSEGSSGVNRTRVAKFVYIVIAMLGVFLGGRAADISFINNSNLVWTLVIMIPISLILVSLILYIGLCAVKDDSRYRLIRNIAITITSIGGTSFRGANLTDADFTKATLPYSDFRSANLNKTSWFQSKKLDLSRIEGTYLEDFQIRHLVTSKNGEKTNYDYKSLRTLNLQNANLIEASLLGADLSESNLVDANFSEAKLDQARLYGANLSNANLTKASLLGADLSQSNLVDVNFSEAKLAQAKLYGVNLSNAILSGACIEDWGISTDLIFDNIYCDRIFMRLITPENENPCRKPDDWNNFFKPGDFADFIFPYIDRLKFYKEKGDPLELGKQLRMPTMDLYHYKDFNSYAALIALKKLAEENSMAELDLLCLDVIGEEKVHLKVAIRGKGDCAELSKKYEQIYNKTKQFSKQEIQKQVELVNKYNDKFNHLVSIFTLPYQGDNIINISVGRDLSGVLNLGEIIGNVNNH